MAAITMNSIVLKAQAVQQSFKKGHQEGKAEENLKGLYQDGWQLVSHEVQNRPLIDQVVTQVMLELDDVVSNEKLQHDPVHGSLSKNYHLFIDLTWYQLWKQQTRPAWTKTRDKILEHSKDAARTLPKKDKALRADFEYACARQAAKLLEPTEKIWMRYLDHLVELGGAAFAKDIAGFWKALKSYFTDIEKDWVRSWYLDTYVMLWSSTQVKTVQDFKKFISPEISKCQQEGGKRAQALVVILHRIIKDKTAPKELRELAFKGDNQHGGLIHVLDWKRDASGLVKHPQEVFAKIFRRPDNFWKARSLTVQYLKKFASAPKDPKNDKYAPFRQESTKILQARLQALQKDPKKPLETEKQQLENAVRELNAKLEARNKEREDLNNTVANLSIGARGPADDAKLEDAIKKLEEINVLEQQTTGLSKEKERVERIAKDLEEERKELEAFLK